MVKAFAASSVALSLGFALTAGGVASWDSLVHYQRSLWLLSRYGLLRHGAPIPPEGPFETVRWYGPFWELILGVFTEWVFPFLKDPHWVRSAVTFSLWALTLLVIYLFVRSETGSQGTAGLAAALLFGYIRLGGHAVTNTNDVPLACASLGIALGSWVVFCRPTKSFRRAAPNAILWGALGAIPFLIRPPFLAPFGFVLVAIAAQAFRAREWSLAARLFLTPLTLIGGISCAVLSFPVLWDTPFAGWGRPFSLFTRFPWDYSIVTAFGERLDPRHLPRWYSFVWPVVSLEPVAFMALIAGLFLFLVALVRRTSPKGPAPLGLWVLAYTLACWLPIVMLRPVLYNEDRHLLFLLPPLLFVASLGLHPLPGRVKAILAVLIACGSLYSYATWGKYSYVYKSPLVGDRRGEQFTGDYWGLCVNDMIRKLPEVVPAPAEVTIVGPWEIGVIQAARLGLNYTFVPARLGVVPKMAIVTSADNTHYGVLRDIDAGSAQLLAEIRMPPDSAACLLVRFPDRR